MSDSPMNDAVLAGVPRLLDDLQKLLETHDHADILFWLAGKKLLFMPTDSFWILGIVISFLVEFVVLLV